MQTLKNKNASAIIASKSKIARDNRDRNSWASCPRCTVDSMKFESELLP